jgi:hypothetical protein
MAHIKITFWGWVGGGVWVVWAVGGGGHPLRSNIPRSALCATLDTYNFYLFGITTPALP